MPKSKNDCPKESWEQEQIFIWSRANQIKCPELQLLNASMNGVRLSVGQRSKMKQQGLILSVPDIFLPIPMTQHAGLFIELKRVKNGRVSIEQKHWLKKLTENHYLAVVCKGHEYTFSYHAAI